MCGIAGLWQAQRTALGLAADELVVGMTRALQHRGPDAEGLWVSPEDGVGLGHRRLSILDLSPAGAQPMHSACGRFVIAYNGEIYNHLAMRAGLPAQSWRGHSDTETLLASISVRGVQATLEQCAGMFAFALWDRQSRTLTLARDRLGEKPLYYAWIDGSFVFASELKALRMHPGFGAAVDRAALAELLARGYIGAPRTIHEGVYKLPPGTLLHLTDADADGVRPTPYWSLREVIERRPASGEATPQEAVEQLQQLLDTVVREQIVADVPVGAFLSGGIDSSLVVATMQTISTMPVRTFTIGFESRAHDESAYASRVARHLGTQHTELRLDDATVLDLMPRAADWFDEPFGDSSAIPTFLVSRLARREVTVCLSGDGGDEMFAGYTRYARLQRHWSRLSRWPLGLRHAASALAVLPLPTRLRTSLAAAGADSAASLYAQMVSQWPAHTPVVLGADRAWPSTEARQDADLGPIESAMYADALGYLPGDILTKVDRTAMANSLETRIPLLDRRIVEWAWRQPLSTRRHDGIAKWPLRQLLQRHLPKELIERPKMGFGVPLDEWLRTTLRPWAEAMLSEERLRREGYFDPRPIRAAWQRHLEGRAQLRDALWPVLMFQQWLSSGQTKTAGRIIP